MPWGDRWNRAGDGSLAWRMRTSRRMGDEPPFDHRLLPRRQTASHRNVPLLVSPFRLRRPNQSDLVHRSGFFLPKFRRAHLVRAGSITLVCLLYVVSSSSQRMEWNPLTSFLQPLTAVTDPVYLLGLPIIAISLELVGPYCHALFGKALHSLHHTRGLKVPHDPRRGPSKSVNEAPGSHTHLFVL